MTVSAFLTRAHLWLDENLFPDPPGPPRITSRRALVGGVLAVVAVTIQLIRMSPSAPLNSIWAEDSPIYLWDAMHRGFFGALATPYNGYLKTRSRS